jgi:hypothetical protein
MNYFFWPRRSDSPGLALPIPGCTALARLALATQGRLDNRPETLDRKKKALLVLSAFNLGKAFCQALFEKGKHFTE